MKRYILAYPSSEDILIAQWNRVNNERKALDVLTGLCLGILADGETNSREARFLHNWVLQTSSLLPDQIADPLLSILDELSKEKDLTEVQNKNLCQILQQILGVSADTNIPRNHNPATDLIFDLIEDPESFDISGLEIVISGQFSFGRKSQVLAEILAFGGLPRDEAPTGKTKILLVGCHGSNQWTTSLMGSKAEKVLERRSKGQEILILKESDFFAFLKNREKPALCSINNVVTENEIMSLPFLGKTFVITGTLSIDRDEMKAFIESKGGKVSGSVSAKTSYVLAGEGGGSKRDKAEKLGVTILDEEGLEKLLK